ncbi:hypothetical protein FMA36_11075 [Komagataeibacter xylinus]|uniref:Uncharacterized protein n=1 Tax=Komagataeibacter xylinus TaxID=28448 RepID=A0A857FNT8_KOMXY|nr:hypothetical protein FMA36_11075 [Komagataeibacter xylinus]
MLMRPDNCAVDHHVFVVVISGQITKYPFDDARVSDLLCIIDLVHTSPKGSMNDHLEGTPGRIADGREAS